MLSKTPEAGERKPGGFGDGGFRRNNEEGGERKPFECRSRDNEDGQGGFKPIRYTKTTTKILQYQSYLTDVI
jgi:hypothetical protein